MCSPSLIHKSSQARAGQGRARRQAATHSLLSASLMRCLSAAALFFIKKQVFVTSSPPWKKPAMAWPPREPGLAWPGLQQEFTGTDDSCHEKKGKKKAVSGAMGSRDLEVPIGGRLSPPVDSSYQHQRYIEIETK